MKLVDLSHSIHPAMPRFSPEAPQPIIRAWQSHAQSAESGRYLDCTCEISAVQFITSLGTYLDSSFHFHPNAPSIEDLKLEQLVHPGIVIDCRSWEQRQPVGPDVLKDLDIKGKAVLFHSGWSKF